MLKLISIFLRMFFLKQKPEALPYSKKLVKLLAILFVVLSVPTNILFSEFLVGHSKLSTPLSPLNVLQSLTIVVVYVGVMLISVYLLLYSFKLQNRFVQTVSSLLGIEILLNLWFLSLLLLPLSALTVLFFILLLYWQFMIHIYIFANSFDINFLKAGLFALLYILLQHNVSEILLNNFVVG